MATVQVEASRDLALERKLAERGLQYEFRPGLPLTEVNVEASLKNQVRLREPLNQDTIDRYRVALGRGVVFPAVILSRSKTLRGLVAYDGNHRIAASKSNGRKTIDAYIVNNASEQAMLQLATEANLEHGLPTSKDDRLHAALYLIEGNMSQKDAANLMGLTQTDISLAVSAHRADRRADTVGILRTQWDKLSPNITRRLGNVSTDEGFAALTQLTIGAKLKAGEVQEAVDTMRDIRSSRGQVEYVESLRTAYSGRLSVAGAGVRRGRQAPPPRTVLAASLAQIKVLPPPRTVTTLMPPDVRAEFRGKISEAIDVLNAYVKELDAESGKP